MFDQWEFYSIILIQSNLYLFCIYIYLLLQIVEEIITVSFP